MTGSGRYRGQPVSTGIAVGEIYQGDARPASLAAEAAAVPPAGAAPDNGHGRADAGRADAGRAHAEDAVRDAFSAVARDRADLAAQLRTRGQGEQAAIVEIAALIAADPALVTAAVAAVSAGASGADAIRQAGEKQAALLEALPNPDLAQRAGDVRQVAKAASDWLTGSTAARPPAGKFILVRREVEAADLIRLADAGLAGAVSVRGSASSHAAIIARGLGLPMVAGADLAVLGATGQRAILNGTAGELITDPAELELMAAEAAVAIQAAAVQDAGTLVAMAAASTAARTAKPGASRRDRLASGSGSASAGGDGVGARGELKTADGQPVTLLCNVASAAETRLGLSAGAAGVGLLRTEIAFTRATQWPSLDDHLAQLTPILGLLGVRPAVVRLLDFSGDKVPPFLASRPRQGLEALLDDDRALRAQLTAILRAGRGAQVSVLVPMVRLLAEVAAVRAALAEVAAAEGAAPPKLGIMVEVAATAANAAAFAAVADFFSIGTNDLTSDVLELDRGADQAATPALAADPRVLVLIRDTVRAAAAAGIPVSVCGDAAADPQVLPLLLGAGIRTLSVGAARVPFVAWDIADTDAATAKAQADGVIG